MSRSYPCQRWNTGMAPVYGRPPELRDWSHSCISNKQTNKKNILLVKTVAVALALNYVKVPWLFAVIAQPIFEQFSPI